MEKDEIKNFICKETSSISEIMQRIDSNSGGVLFLVTDDYKIRGSITDGDIRRYLLAGGKLTDVADRAANHSPRMAATIEDARKLYDSRDFVAVPIVSEDGTIIDIYTHVGRFPRERKKIYIPIVINAGGKGTRLDPYTRVLPKPLIPIGELPIIEHIMKGYQEYGCDNFHIIVNYKRQIIKGFFSENENDYHIKWYDESRPLGTGGGLALLRNDLKSTFIFSNCDSLLTSDYAKIFQFHKDNENIVTMVCAYKNYEIPYGVVEMGVDGKIEAMQEKPLLSFLTNTGIYILEPKVFEYIYDDECIGFPAIVERLREANEKVAVYPISDNEWMDMGQLDELEKMRIRITGDLQ